MNVVYFGEGDVAWFEPETIEEFEFIAEARKGEWTAEKTLAEAVQRGLVTS